MWPEDLLALSEEGIYSCPNKYFDCRSYFSPPSLGHLLHILPWIPHGPLIFNYGLLFPFLKNWDHLHICEHGISIHLLPVFLLLAFTQRLMVSSSSLSLLTSIVSFSSFCIQEQNALICTYPKKGLGDHFSGSGIYSNVSRNHTVGSFLSWHLWYTTFIKSLW